MERAKRGSKPIHYTILRLFPIISIAYHISRYGQLSRPYLQPCLKTGPRSKLQQSRSSNLETGLLLLFGTQLRDLFEGVGAMVGRAAALGPRFYDGLVETVEYNFILILPLSGKTKLISASLLWLLFQPDVQTLSLRLDLSHLDIRRKTRRLPSRHRHKVRQWGCYFQKEHSHGYRLSNHHR